MKKSFIKVFLIVILLLVLTSLTTVYSATEQKEEPEQNIFNLEYIKQEENSNIESDLVLVEGLYQEGVLLYSKDSPEMVNFLESVKKSVHEDALKGFEKLKETIPTRDNIELQQWGLFLFKYTGKEITEYPTGDIVFTVGLNTYNIKSTKASKTWIKEVLLPMIYEVIYIENENYPAAMYKLNIKAGLKLIEFDIDMEDINNYIELYKLYPLSGKVKDIPNEYIVYNTGTYYGLILDSEYVNILQGYHNELEDMKSISVDIPACADVLAYITLPKNLSDLTLKDKSLKDMTIYKGLAVNLITKELLDTSNLTTNGVTLNYKDYSLKEEELILVYLKDIIVIVQPIFVECFEKWGLNLNTVHYIDFTNFLIGLSEEVELKHMYEDLKLKVHIKNYVSDDGFVDLRLDGRYPFSLYTRFDSPPYERIIKRLYGPDGASLISKENLKKLTNIMKEDLKEQGRIGDFESYMKAAGQKSSPLIFLFILLILLIVVILIISKNRRKHKDKPENRDLLFNPEDEE